MWRPGAPGSRSSPSAAGRRDDVGVVRFGRDVGINVVANLVAAAIIYLAATYSDALPTNEVLLDASIVVLMAAVVLATVAVGRARTPYRTSLTLAVAIGALLVLVALNALMPVRTGILVWLALIGVVAGVLVPVFRRERRQAEALARPTPPVAPCPSCGRP